MSDKNKVLTDTRFILTQDSYLRHCIICDIDGTLALINGRSPYDDKLVYTDKLNQPVADLIRKLHRTGTAIVYLSGRMETSRSVTEEWLYENNMWFPDQQLFMRKKDDYRQDAIVKKELYEEHIKDKYYVEAVFDDLDQVVNMWREEGLLCCQVYYGNF